MEESGIIVFAKFFMECLRPSFLFYMAISILKITLPATLIALPFIIKNLKDNDDERDTTKHKHFNKSVGSVGEIAQHDGSSVCWVD